MVADAEAYASQSERPLLDSTRERREFRGSFSGYERDHFYLNTDGNDRRMFDSAYVHGVDFIHDGRSVVPVDVDGDGDLDLALLGLQGLRLAENTSPARRFVRVRLRATGSQHHAIGARVSVRTGDRVQQDVVRSTDGFQSQVALELHFGLADAERVDEIEVHWPSGKTERWLDLATDCSLLLTEGEPGARVSEIPRWPEESRPRPLKGAAVDLVAETLGGERAPLAEPGRPAVINLWAPWCAPCTKELPELRALHEELGDRVSFVGVSVETSDRATVEERLAASGGDYPQFLADAELLEAFFGPEGEAVLPSTFVFDQQGKLRRVFRRAISSGELESLLESFGEEHDFVADFFQRGVSLVKRGNIDEAIRHFRWTLEADPEYSQAHFEVGKLYARAGRHELAEVAFGNAVRLDPGLAEAHYNLGVARMSLGKPRDAIAPLSENLRLGGEDYPTLMQLGSAQAQLGELLRALDAFDRATKAAPGEPDGFAFKGMVLADLDEVEEARRMLERVLELAPEHALAKRLLDRLPR